jgi:hypothetical protein
MVRFISWKYNFLIAGLILLMIIVSSVADGKIDSHEKGRQLRIIYSGNLMGHIEPCG